MSKTPRSTPRMGKPAELMPRFQAKLIDWVVVLMAVFVVTIVVSLNVSDAVIGNLVSTVAGVVLVVGYFTVMESATGRTLGKLVLHLSVVNLVGGKPTVTQTLKRNAYAAVPLIGVVPVLGEQISGFATVAAYSYVAATIYRDAPAYRGRHDELGDTQVVTTR